MKNLTLIKEDNKSKLFEDSKGRLFNQTLRLKTAPYHRVVIADNMTKKDRTSNHVISNVGTTKIAMTRSTILASDNGSSFRLAIIIGALMVTTVLVTFTIVLG